MKTLKRIAVIGFVIIFMITLVSVSAFAVDPVSFTEAEALGATIIDLYGAYNNTSLAYEELTSSGALTEIITLYQDYSTAASDPYTLAAIGAAAAAAGAIAVIYDAVTGQGYVQLYQEQYVSSMDGYWDYQLTDAGLVRDAVTGLFNWNLNQNNEIAPINLVTISGSPFFGQPYSAFTTQINVINGTVVQCNMTDNNNIYFANKYETNPNFGTLIAYSTVNNTMSTWVAGGTYKYYMPRSSIVVNGVTYYYDDATGNPGGYNGMVQGVPTYQRTSSETNEQYLTKVINAIWVTQYPSSNIDIEPSTYIGDPLQNPLEITIPDNTDPDYQPTPTRITTTIPWNPDWGDPLPDGVSTPEYGVPYSITDPSILNEAVPEIWAEIVANGAEIQDAPEPIDPGPAPSEVYVPFLPIALPSFDFSLSGIWHYVTAWVASLGAWFTMVFSVWAALPYALVVPVYASAVIVIVLGVYKRFFM